MPLFAFSRHALLPPWAFGLPFFLFAIALAGQTYFTSQRGYMYCGRTARVEKKKDPAKYRFWLCFHIAWCVFFIGLSTFGFWL